MHIIIYSNLIVLYVKFRINPLTYMRVMTVPLYTTDTMKQTLIIKFPVQIVIYLFYLLVALHVSHINNTPQRWHTTNCPNQHQNPFFSKNAHASSRQNPRTRTLRVISQTWVCMRFPMTPSKYFLNSASNACKQGKREIYSVLV